MSIKHKRKAITNYNWIASDLVDGQIGVNTVDGTLHTLKTDNTVAQFPNTKSGDITIITGDGTETSGQNIDPLVFTKITNCNTVVVNPTGAWDTTNKWFKPTKAGWYQIGASQVLGNTTGLDADSKVIMVVYKKDVRYKLAARGYSGGVGGVLGFSGSVLCYLNGTTDYLTVNIYHSSSVSTTNYKTTDYNFFSAEWVGI